MMVAVGVYGPGRQVKRFCKRGHPRVRGKRCQKCHTLCQTMRYSLDPEYREQKKQASRQRKARARFDNLVTMTCVIVDMYQSN